MTHRGFDGEPHTGVLIVREDVTSPIIGAFRELFAAGYPIERMRPASDFGGDDGRSMTANNTSAFNCRPVTGRKRGFSTHSYGRAVDVNPLYNPYVKGNRVQPPAGVPRRDRSRDHPAMLCRKDRAVHAFTRRGFVWGGAWKRLRDYQHFELSR